MAYARFGEGDVYIIGTYLGVKEVFDCVGCFFRCQEWVEDDGWLGGRLVPAEGDPGPFVTPSRQKMLDHLRDHLAAGHDVPDHAFTGIFEETEWGQP